FHVVVSATKMSLRIGFGRRTVKKHLVPSTENPIWNGEGYSPIHSGSRRNVARGHLRGLGAGTSKTATVFARRLLIMQTTAGLSPGLKPDSWIGLFTPSSLTSQVSGELDTLVRAWLSLPLSLALRKQTGSQFLRSRMIPPPHMRRPRTENRSRG